MTKRLLSETQLPFDTYRAGMTMPNSTIKFIADCPDSTSYQRGTLSVREGLNCIADIASELQAIASRAGLEIPAMLLGEAAAQARSDLSQME
jgi:hypothetical protein